jgi:tripartite-type tricarboxylate transporter receptor subunit TctC
VPISISGWHVLAVPAGTPPEVMQRLNHALDAANAKAGVKAQLFKAGVQPVTSSIEEAQAMVKAEYTRWGEVARKAGLKPQ